jgi:hypothetical protein
MKLLNILMNLVILYLAIKITAVFIINQQQPTNMELFVILTYIVSKINENKES